MQRVTWINIDNYNSHVFQYFESDYTSELDPVQCVMEGQINDFIELFLTTKVYDIIAGSDRVELYPLLAIQDDSIKGQPFNVIVYSTHSLEKYQQYTKNIEFLKEDGTDLTVHLKSISRHLWTHEHEFDAFEKLKTLSFLNQFDVILGKSNVRRNAWHTFIEAIGLIRQYNLFIHEIKFSNDKMRKMSYDELKNMALNINMDAVFIPDSASLGKNIELQIKSDKNVNNYMYRRFLEELYEIKEYL